MKAYILILSVFLVSSSKAQMLISCPSPRSMALCGSDIATSQTALNTNPALADVKSSVAIGYLPLPSGLEGSYAASAAGVVVIDPGNALSAAIQRSQYQSLYSLEDIGVQYSARFRIDTLRVLTTGVRLHYSTESFGDHYLPVNELQLDAGARFNITSNLAAGVAIINLARLSHNQDAPIGARSTSLGLSFQPDPSFTLHTALEVAQDQPVDVRAGLEYQLESFLALRIGAETLTGLISGGVGINYEVIKLDFALQKHPDLGNSLSFSLGYDL